MQPQTKAHIIYEVLSAANWQPQRLTTSIGDEAELLLACLEEAIILRQAGCAQLSLQLIDQAFALGLNSPWLQDNQARALLELEQQAEALAIWLELSKEADSHVAAISVAMLIEHGESSHIADPVIGFSELTISVSLYSLEEAIRLRNEGQHQASLTYIDAALGAGESDPWWLDNKARVLVELNNPIEALQLWEQLSATANDGIGDEAKEMLKIYKQKLLAALVQICEQNSWKPLYLTAQDQSIQLQLLQELAASRKAGEIDLSLRLIAQAKQLGFKSDWIKDNEARALVHLDRLQEAVDLWHDLESSNDASVVASAVKMLAFHRPKIELRERQQYAEQLLDQGEAAAAEGQLLLALQLNTDHANCRQLLMQSLVAQLGGGDGGLLGTEIRERELKLEGHARLLAQFEQRMELISVSEASD